MLEWTPPERGKRSLAMDGPGMRNPTPILGAALMVWFATVGSSCQTTTGSDGLRVQSSNGATVALVAVFAAYCLLDRKACGGEPSPEQLLDDKFEEGVRRFKAGDPSGLQQVCWLAHSGYPKAQYYYGVELFKERPQDTRESVGWLKRASAQGYRAADFMLDQVPRTGSAQGAWEPDVAECGYEDPEEDSTAL